MENNEKKFNQNEYKKQYGKEHYKSISFRIKPEKVDYIRDFAASRNMSIPNAIIAALEYIDENGIDITPKITDELLGEMTFDESLGSFEGEVEISGQNIYFGISVDDINDKETVDRLISEFKKFISEFDRWDKRIREFAAKSLTDCANDWLQDSLEDGEPFIEITEERFAQRMVLNSIGYDENGFEVYYDDDDMFWGHCILVYGTLENGIEEAQIAG